MNLTLEQKEVFAKALAAAICHIARIGNREHIKADRIERVCLFITSLRTKLKWAQHGVSWDQFTLIMDSLTRKEIWYDAGILHISITGSGVNSGDFVRELLSLAEMHKTSLENVAYQIESDMDGLSQTLSGMAGSVVAMEKVNIESESLIDSLCELLT